MTDDRDEQIARIEEGLQKLDALIERRIAEIHRRDGEFLLSNVEDYSPAQNCKCLSLYRRKAGWSAAQKQMFLGTPTSRLELVISAEHFKARVAKLADARDLKN